MRIVLSFMGSSIIDMATYPADDTKSIVAILRPVFAPKLTNDVAIDVYVRTTGTEFKDRLIKTCYPNFKADTVGLDRDGTTLKVFAGTHDPDKTKVDANGKRPNQLEVEDVLAVFA